MVSMKGEQPELQKGKSSKWAGQWTWAAGQPLAS